MAQLIIGRAFGVCTSEAFFVFLGSGGNGYLCGVI